MFVLLVLCAVKIGVLPLVFGKGFLCWSHLWWNKKYRVWPLRTEHGPHWSGLKNGFISENITWESNEMCVANLYTLSSIQPSLPLRPFSFIQTQISLLLAGVSLFLHCIHSKGEKNPHKCHFTFQAICYRQLHHYFVQINLHKSLLGCFIFATLFGSQSTN